MSSSWPPPPPPAAPVLACYRHPKVPAPVTCTRCERPICSDCMVSAPVGWQCPACQKGNPAVKRMRDIPVGGAGGGRPFVTFGLLGAIAAMYVVQMGDAGTNDRLSVVANKVADGEWWRVLTYGFLHGGAIHILFNALLLFQLGSVLEERLGRVRFVGIYAASLIGGGIGAMLLESPDRGTVGASGAVFGMMGALLVLRRTGRSPIEAGLGGLIVINLAISFLPGISLGGHLGGLLVGILIGLVIRLVGEGGDLRLVAGTAAILAALIVGLLLATFPAADWAVRTGGFDLF